MTQQIPNSSSSGRESAQIEVTPEMASAALLALEAVLWGAEGVLISREEMMGVLRAALLARPQYAGPAPKARG